MKQHRPVTELPEANAACHEMMPGVVEYEERVETVRRGVHYFSVDGFLNESVGHPVEGILLVGGIVTFRQQITGPVEFHRNALHVHVIVFLPFGPFGNVLDSCHRSDRLACLGIAGLPNIQVDVPAFPQVWSLVIRSDTLSLHQYRIDASGSETGSQKGYDMIRTEVQAYGRTKLVLH